MGMDSDKIKAIVAQVKALEKGEEGPESVMSAMSRDMARSPTLAVAIIQRLREEGINLLEQDGEEAEAFRAKFQPQMEKLGQSELAQLSRISGKLFGS